MGITLTDVTRARFDTDTFGTNVLGYYLFIALFALWYFYISSNTSKGGIFILFLLCLVFILGLYLLILGATRGGIVIAIVTIFFFIYSKIAINKSTIFKTLYFILIGVIVYIAVALLFKALDNLFIYERFANSIIETKEEPRWELLIKSINVGFDHFFVGVGAGNVSLFLNGAISHSSFTEIFANHGILGLFLLSYIFIDFFKQALKLKRSDSSVLNRYGVFFTSFIIVFALYNLLYVMYLNTIVMGFFYLVRSHLYILHSTRFANYDLVE